MEAIAAVSALKIWGPKETVLTKFNNFNYLIVGIGLNTNVSPKNKDFQSTSLKNIVNRKINNQKILRNILNMYGKFLDETERLSFSSLKRKYK